MSNARPCPHLAPIVDILTRAGAEVVAVLPASGDAKFVHQLSKGPTGHLARALAVAHNVEYWRNNDRHYDLESGLLCRACGLAVSWLQTSGIIDAV
jgi:hypothetical protein